MLCLGGHSSGRAEREGDGESGEIGSLDGDTDVEGDGDGEREGKGEGEGVGEGEGERDIEGQGSMVGWCSSPR